MFVGKYYNSIDSKSRLIIPAKFREELGPKCVISGSLDDCLTIYTLQQWEKFVEEKLEKLPQSNPQARKLQNYFYSTAANCDVDKQGRMTISQELIEHAGIVKDLVTIGKNRVIEVWSRESWEKQLDPDTGRVMSVSELAESMEQYGF